MNKISLRVKENILHDTLKQKIYLINENFQMLEIIII